MICRDDGMIEEFKGVATNQDSDLDHADELDDALDVKRKAGARNEAAFEEADCESDYED